MASLSWDTSVLVAVVAGTWLKTNTGALLVDAERLSGTPPCRNWGPSLWAGDPTMVGARFEIQGVALATPRT